MKEKLLFSNYREQIRNYITFNDEEWNVFFNHLNVKNLKKNECFAQSGKVCEEMGFILKGSVRYSNIIDGQEITGYFTFENHFVTALKSYLTGEPALYDIKALEETTFVTITKKSMQEMIEHPLLSFKIERLGRLISEQFNILFEDRIKSFIIKSPEERYLDLLASSQNVIKRIPLQFIAQFIGITPVSLSRIRKRIHQ